MNVEMVVLRLVHIVFGAFWVGAAVMLTFVIVPRVRALGPAHYGPVMAAVGKTASQVMLGSGLITVLAGIVLVFRLRGDNLDKIYDTGWGYAITLGFVVSVTALIIGVFTGITGNRIGALAAAGGEGPPDPETMAEMQRLDARLTLLSRTATVLVVIAVGAMASARFV